jgi:adenosine deaminase
MELAAENLNAKSALFAAPTLLISLGTSPAVVPEAFLLPEVRFGAVHVLTTEKPDVTLIRDYFAQHAPEVALTLSRVAGFDDFASEADHFRFEEVLHRWVLDLAPDPAVRFFCLSGGFKTMSAAMQKAAEVHGASEVFHVLADQYVQGPERMRFPETIAEIQTAMEGGRLKWIRLGGEAGWPQFRAATPEEYPLEVVDQNGPVRWLRAPDTRFRERLRTVVERSHRIADAWEGLADLPFVELAAWSPHEVQWLRQPLDPSSAADRRWVARLPKLELHCHLGGFATGGDLLRRVRAGASRPESLPGLADIPEPSDWPLPARPVGLESYRAMGNNNGSALLKDPGCLTLQCELLYQQLIDERVLHAEIRCSPANYADPARDRSAWDVLMDIKQTFDRRMRAGHSADSCHVNLIVIGTRQTGGDYRANISRHLALAVTAAEHWKAERECRVVGVDLAGFEDETTRAHYFREEFAGVHRCGLALTAHAGENDDAEGIWRAVFDLNARRIGHALSLTQSPDLIRSVADRRIGVEMCPYANHQIRGFSLDSPSPAGGSKANYPLLDYLRKGVCVSVNTDNIGISRASLGENLLLVSRLCPGLTRLELLWLQRNALESAFLAEPLRRDLIKRFSSAIPLP